MAESMSVKNKYRLLVFGLLTVLVLLSNLARFPFLGSQIHPGNPVCVLCGFILGPWLGFLSAGAGSLLYDLYAGRGLECLVTFVSKGAIALVAALVSCSVLRSERLRAASLPRLFLAAMLGALTYVALYMLKTLISQSLLLSRTEGGSFSIVTSAMAAKLPASLINACFAALAAPPLMLLLFPSLRRIGLPEQKE